MDFRNIARGFYKQAKKAPEKILEVSSVAVVCDGHILMAKRKDTDKFTLPGGHLDPGEDAHDGAVRELMEEAGIEAAKHMTRLDEKVVLCEDGKKRRIHAWLYSCPTRPNTTMQKDPDDEVYRWRWIKITDNRLPEEIASNLHSPKNVTLKALNIKNVS